MKTLLATQVQVLNLPITTSCTVLAHSDLCCAVAGRKKQRCKSIADPQNSGAAAEPAAVLPTAQQLPNVTHWGAPICPGMSSACGHGLAFGADAGWHYVAIIAGHRVLPHSPRHKHIHMQTVTHANRTPCSNLLY